MAKRSVLMVCTANICRSPMAQGILLNYLEHAGQGRLLRVDSAGTRVMHAGPKPDPRSQQIAKSQGIDISRFKARAVKPRDFIKHDLVIAMDKTNAHHLLEHCPEEQRHKIHLMMDFAPHLKLTDVPDPYYGNIAGFQEVYRLLDIACRGLVEHLQQNGYA